VIIFRTTIILAEIFLQDLEQNRVKHLLEHKKIEYYYRYIDDIFVIYDQTKTIAQTKLQQFNIQHKDIIHNKRRNGHSNYLPRFELN
jgi:hypothetical protein